MIRLVEGSATLVDVPWYVVWLSAEPVPDRHSQNKVSICAHSSELVEYARSPPRGIFVCDLCALPMLSLIAFLSILCVSSSLTSFAMVLPVVVVVVVVV